MKVTCCDCGKSYLYPEECVKETIDLKDGNVADRIKCPHCGLEHLVVWVKVRRKVASGGGQNS